MTNSKTFRSIETWRASEIGGGGRLVRTETVHADGRVVGRVMGRSDDDGAIDQKYARHCGTELDLDAVTAARLRSGWTLV